MSFVRKRPYQRHMTTPKILSCKVQGRIQGFWKGGSDVEGRGSLCYFI